jgi:hypothetical protein
MNSNISNDIMVTDEEFKELIDCARSTKKKFIDALCDKNLIEELKEYDIKSSVNFIADAKLIRPSHIYRINFIKKAIIQRMGNLLEKEINKIISDKEIQ